MSGWGEGGGSFRNSYCPTECINTLRSETVGRHLFCRACFIVSVPKRSMAWTLVGWSCLTSDSHKWYRDGIDCWLEKYKYKHCFFKFQSTANSRKHLQTSAFISFVFVFHFQQRLKVKVGYAGTHIQWYTHTAFARVCGTNMYPWLRGLFDNNNVSGQIRWERGRSDKMD